MKTAAIVVLAIIALTASTVVWWELYELRACRESVRWCTGGADE